MTLRLTISRRSAVWAAFAAMTARMFLALAVDTTTTHNGAWLSALLGGLLAAPLALGLSLAGPSRRRALRLPLGALLAAATLMDAATCLTAVTRSAGYLALDRVPTFWLALPAALAAFWCACRNGDAIGRCAMVCARLIPALLLIVVLLQAKSYRPGWLFPILGDGWQSVAAGGLSAAGCAAPAAAVLLLGEASDGGRPSPLPAALGAGFAVAALLALRLMTAPATPGADSWLNRLDALLVNGRSPLYVQLPLIALWYTGLMSLLACECFTAAALMQRALPSLDGRACGALAALIPLVLSQAALPERAPAARLYPWLYILAALATALALAGKDGNPCAA